MNSFKTCLCMGHVQTSQKTIMLLQNILGLKRIEREVII